MCGIAGFVGLSIPKEEARFALVRMCDAIFHRGPNSAGYFYADNVAMGMRRLSIIDVAGGDQPIYNEDSTIAVVFNGEIYNHRELRRQLTAQGHVFRTHSDTEVLVHLYEEYGSDMPSYLHGMFAYSIWDSRNRVLLVARDHSGMKPLAYAEVDGGLVYCSELRSISALEYMDLQIDPLAVSQFFAFGYVPDPLTIFRNVRKLPPGHQLRWSPGQSAVINQFWKVPDSDNGQIDKDAAIAELRVRLESAVASHLESEVPLGAFLSGGLDSSTVVSLMSRVAKGRVKTFSIGFSEDKYDESAAARAVAEYFKTEHTELIVSPKADVLLESIATMFDEPFGDTSAIPTFLVAQLAKQGVTVALSGDGGDELFGGYSRYRETLAQRASWSTLGKAVTAAAKILPHSAPGRNYLLNMGRSAWGRYASTVVAPVRLDEGGLINPNIPGSQIAVDEQLARFVPNDASADFAAAMMNVDFRTYLPGDILTKVDRTSMAVSLEARVPLLDVDLVEFAMRLPGRLRVNPHSTKILFREVIADIVPGFVLNQPKRGFAIPLSEWFRGPLRHRIDSLRTLDSKLLQYVDLQAVQRTVAEHQSGRRDHSSLLWRLIVLQAWLANLEAGDLARPPVVPQCGLM